MCPETPAAGLELTPRHSGGRACSQPWREADSNSSVALSRNQGSPRTHDYSQETEEEKEELMCK